ncbi:MAG: hypothetical protein ACLUD0_10765 [Eubacterium ramulus]
MTKNGKIDRNKLMKLYEESLHARHFKSNTPAFVFDTAALKKRVAQIKEIVGETVSLCYSMKANPFFVPAMITCVDKLEVCSPGELTICKKLGVDASRIIYSGVNKEIPDIKEAYEYGVGTFTAESVRQADLIQQVVETAAAGEKAEVILRLNSGSQFGMSKRICLRFCSAEKANTQV